MATSSSISSLRQNTADRADGPAPRTASAATTTTAILRRLDPILQELLPLVASYRQLWEQEQQERLEDESLLISHLKSLISTLERLYRELFSIQQEHKRVLSTDACDDTNATSQAQQQQSLILLAEYISLPLTAIFHVGGESTQPQTATAESSDKTTTSIHRPSRQNAILDSYQWRLHQTTARCIECYAKILAYAPPNREDSSPKAPQLPSKISIQRLIALSYGIPKDVASEPNDKTDNHGLVYRSLDDGSQAYCSIYSAILSILPLCPTQELEMYGNGGLVARLADTCMTVLSQPPLAAYQISTTVRLAAIEVINFLLEKCTMQKLTWQRLFPGVLVGLYRQFLSCQSRDASRTTENRKIACLCLQCVGSLLRVAVSANNDDGLGSPKASTNKSSVLSVLQGLEEKAKSTTQDSGEGTLPRPSTEKEVFLANVREKAVPPLTLLLRMAASGSTGTFGSVGRNELGIQAVRLCQIVLSLETKCDNVWKDTSLSETALECCLMLQRMESDELATIAKTALQDYLSELDKLDRDRIIAKIFALIQELSVLVQGTKRSESRICMQTIVGYLDIFGNDLGLVASTLPVETLSRIMEINVTLSDERPILSISDEGNSMKETTQLPYRFLQGDSIRLSKTLLESLGRSLGSKQAAFAIDLLAVRFLQDVQLARTTSNWGQIQASTGNLVVAESILLGAFAGKEHPKESKRLRKKQKILQALSSSVLPLLVDVLSMIDYCVAGDQNLSQRKVYGCTSVLCLLLVTSFARVLETSNLRLYLPTILYPLVQKTAENEVAMVQVTAQRALRVCASICQWNTVADLLLNEYSHLISCLVGSLRLPGGKTDTVGFTDIATTLSVSRSMAWVLTTVTGDDCCSKSLKQELFLGARKIGYLLMERFDQHLLVKELHDKNIQELLRMYDATLKYMRTIFSPPVATSLEQEASKVPKPWIELIEQLVIPSSSAFDGHQTTMPPVVDQKSEAARGIEVSQEDIDFVSKIIFRVSYLLSNSSIRVQIASCETLSLAFEFLARKTSVNYTHADHQAETSVQNAILRQVASTWPTVKARISSVSELSLPLTGIRSLVISVESNQDAEFRHKLLLGRFLILFANMCECSGDFLADRFRTIVWPIVSNQFSHLIRKLTTTTAIAPIADIADATYTKPSPARHPFQDAPMQVVWTDSEKYLLLAMMECLRRILLSHCGRSLMSILQPLGQIVLPLLEDVEDEVCMSAFETIKCIISIDSDVLLRPLLELSGNDLPPSPLVKPSYVEVCDSLRVESAGEDMSGIKRRYEDLLVFARSVEEQVVG